MTIRDAAETIKATVSAEEAARLYGFQTDRTHTIRCPFHGDTDASLHFYPGQRGWCCFGCHAGGTVIDFVMRMEGVGFTEAVRILDSRLGLHQLDRADLDSSRTVTRRARLDAVKAALIDAWDAIRRETERAAAAKTRATAGLAAIPRSERTFDDWIALYLADAELEDMDETLRDITHRKEAIRAWTISPVKHSRQPSETIPSSPAQPSGPSPAPTAPVSLAEALRQAENRLTAALG